MEHLCYKLDVALKRKLFIKFSTLVATILMTNTAYLSLLWLQPGMHFATLATPMQYTTDCIHSLDYIDSKDHILFC